MSPWPHSLDVLTMKGPRLFSLYNLNTDVYINLSERKRPILTLLSFATPATLKTVSHLLVSTNQWASKTQAQPCDGVGAVSCSDCLSLVPVLI